MNNIRQRCITKEECFIWGLKTMEKVYYKSTGNTVTSEVFASMKEEYKELLSQFQNGAVDLETIQSAFDALLYTFEAAMREHEAALAQMRKDEEAYKSLREQFEKELAAYNQAKQQFEHDLAIYNAARDQYEDELASYNKAREEYEQAVLEWEQHQKERDEHGEGADFSFRIVSYAPPLSNNINGRTEELIAPGITLVGGGPNPFTVVVEDGAAQGTFILTLKNGNTYIHYQFTITGSGTHNLTIVNQSGSSGFGIGEFKSNGRPVFSQNPPVSPNLDTPEFVGIHPGQAPNAPIPPGGTVPDMGGLSRPEGDKTEDKSPEDNDGNGSNDFNNEDDYENDGTEESGNTPENDNNIDDVIEDIIEPYEPGVPLGSASNFPEDIDEDIIEYIYLDEFAVPLGFEPYDISDTSLSVDAAPNLPANMPQAGLRDVQLTAVCGLLIAGLCVFVTLMKIKKLNKNTCQLKQPSDGIASYGNGA